MFACISRVLAIPGSLTTHSISILTVGPYEFRAARGAQSLLAHQMLRIIRQAETRFERRSD
jgi:hypothetical protein